ncbi:hypothetical protein [Kallotenue papyrolyticum]|uniref:hypothetical protein n=1 Tax=Kallotenue papyrolyticum TaxID=1325125 RepID=UPI000478595E|nr:hypothetical protein [Kallotenue papyrolyticum]
MTGIETTIVERLGLIGILLLLLIWSARAVWIWYTQTAWPRRLAVQEKAAEAQVRIADLCEGLRDLVVDVHRRLDDVQLDIARMYELRREEQPSRLRRRQRQEQLSNARG